MAARPPRRRLFPGLPAAPGFTLVELLLALLLGCLLSALMLQCVLSETRSGQRLARLLRERQASQRLLELIRSELQQASAASIGAAAATALPPACNLGSRPVVLQMQTPAGVISYSQGAAPDAIWRGAVLMRCGPAYGLDGQLGSGTSQNRVVLDALVADTGFTVQPSAQGGSALAEVRLRRSFAAGGQLQEGGGMLLPLPPGPQEP
ncbi:prepilin-type N-terminal cleavage/methylation domain-containing protein [Cyanobium sp. NIES-981]|uniref:prepilin-type N-terminal cleavage/methylation domain-containing protein n=1 Tax=Cyanobium sp. NIES-981 TaxID=1851505 RepID=UPI0007DE21CF|nr:prepilin-type N-terminal cleavage/methylation domain-containing protein [Cyanobium sp. NIES-981]SBO43202.1 conserved protein of unknown function [Cyanobium sp. NIES-981]